MANKDFKVKNGIDIQSPLPVTMGGTGQTSTTNTLNSLLPAQTGNANKVLQTDGTNTTWYTVPAAYTRGATGARPGSPTAGDLHFNTDYNYFEQYTSLGWFPIAAVPGTPTGVTATNQGSGRAYNNGQSSVAFTPNTSAGYPSSFIVTPTPSTSPTTFTGTSSPVTVTGLQSSTQYTYTVTATSAYGTSTASAASAGVTATTVPQAPTIGTASVAGVSGEASVTFTAGATGGSAITSYTATSNPGGITGSSSSSPITITGLTNGTAYTFTVTATNANGTSSASSASNSVTPTDYLLPTSYEPIAVMTVPAGGLSSITFGNIPQTYTSLQVRCIIRITGASNRESVKLYFNSDTATNYARHLLWGDGGSASAYGQANDNYVLMSDFAGASASANIYGAAVVDILDYANTNKFKTARGIGGVDLNAAVTVYDGLFSAVWRNTNAITTMTLVPFDNSNFAQYSSFALYGIKGA
jgi:hypothetical protein